MEFRYKNVRVGCYHQELNEGRYFGSAYLYLYGEAQEPLAMVHVIKDAPSGEQALAGAREAAIFYLDEIASL